MIALVIRMPNVGTAAGALILGASILTSGCTSVPKESVELSYLVGQDLRALHDSYTVLVRTHFAGLRRDIDAKIDEVFVPAFVDDFVERGQLVSHVQNDRPDLVAFWAREAVRNIDAERQERLAPIDQAEAELLESIDRAFSRVIHANAVVTAHLNSIREVEEVQTELIDRAGLRDVRDQITDALVSASEEAKRIEGQIDDVAEALEGGEG